jgi:superkiller protein 3
VVCLLKEGKIAEAEVRLNGLAAKRQKEAMVLRSRGRIALRKARLTEDPSRDPALQQAEDYFNEVLSSSPNHYMTRVLLGRTLCLKGEMVKAIKTLEAATVLAPAEPDAYFELARVYRRSGEIETAVELLKQGKERGPERADGLLLFGETIFRYRHQLDEGLTAMRLAVKKDPLVFQGKEQLTAALIQVATKAMGKKKYEDTLRAVEEVLALMPDHIMALKLRGEIYNLIHAVDKALADFKRCNQLFPEDRETKMLLARCLIRKGYQLLVQKNREEALAHFQEAVMLKAPDVDLTVVRRLLEQDKGRDSEKEGGSGREARALFEEASALLEAGQAKVALEKFRRSVDLLPNNPFAHHQIGIALDVLGQPEEATRALKLALSQGEAMKIDLPATYLKLAEIALKAERYEEAEAYLDRHAALFPELAGDPVAKSLKRLLLLK